MPTSTAIASSLTVPDLANQLMGHPFLRFIFDENQPSLKAALERIHTSLRDTGNLPSRSRESDDDSYIFTVSRRTVLLLSRTGRLTESLRMLLSSPGAGYLRRVGIDRANWMEYHYANYVVSLASVGDISLLLTSAVYSLGLAHRYCSSDIVKSNRKIKNTDTKRALDDIESVISAHRASRNLFLHRGEALNLEGTSGTGLFPYLQLLSLVERVAPDFNRSRELSSGFTSEARAMRPIFSEELDKLAEALEAWLSTLLPVLQQHLAEQRR